MSDMSLLSVSPGIVLLPSIVGVRQPWSQSRLGMAGQGWE
jgi:hypothetical protein